MADTKISNLTADASPTSDDLLITVNDPAGTPANRKVTIDNLDDYLSASTKTLTNKTFDANGTGNSLSNVETADIAAGSKSGSDTTLITGTAGTNGNLAQWNADGDAVDASVAASDVLLKSTKEHSKSITIESPTSSEDLSMFFTNAAITVTEMRAVLRGSSTPSVTWTVRHGTDRSAAGAEVVTSGTTTTSTTTGSDVTVFNDATIVADSFVWLETTAQSGTVDELNLTVIYTED